MHTFAIHGEKGGDGKTTLAVTAAAYLARQYRVLLIDADPQGHATVSFDVNRAPGLYDLMVRAIDLNKLVQRVHPNRLLANPNHVHGSLYVLPGNTETHAIVSQVEDVFTLRDGLQEFGAGIDIVIIDCAPTPGMLMSHIYAAANGIIIPAKMERLSLDGLVATTQRIAKASVTFPGLELIGVVPNQLKPKTVLHTQNLKALQKAAEQFEWPLWPSIALSTVWGEASNEQLSVFAYAAHRSRAHMDAEAFGARVEQEVTQWAKH